MWNLANICLVFCLLSTNYVQQIEDERKQRDLLFGNGLSSPLAQVGGALLEGTELVFGSSPGADLRWTYEGVEPNHLRVLRRNKQIFLEPVEGTVFDVETKAAINLEEWTPNTMYQAGPVVLVLRDHPVGPIVRILDPGSERISHFQGLDYFPVDETLRVLATIRPHPIRSATILDTQGWERPAWVFGKIVFSVQDKQQTLDLILFDEDPGKDSEFMVIFRDLTSGKETYSACRYLYIPFQREGRVWVDFNRAFNPSCAYAGSFACPLPLPGNRLNVAIHAGERAFSKAPH